MTDFFFKDNKCGIGNLIEKPVFKFVADCDIEPTPKPIFDCPVPIIPREPEIPCPEFNVKSKLEVGFSDGSDRPVENCGVENKIKFEIKKKVDDSCPRTANNCEFDVDLEVAIAIPVPPCPVLKVGEFAVKSGFKDQPCVEEDNRFEIRTRKIPGQKCDDPGSCEFEIDLNIVVPIPRPPCPEISVNTFSVRSDYADNCNRGQNRFEITPRHRPPTSCDDAGECKFDVDLEIFIPIPRPPCPDIKITTFSVESGFDYENCPAKENKFEIRRRYEPAPCDDPLQPGRCDFEVDLQIFVPIPQPPCPSFVISTFEIRSGYANSPCVDQENKFSITPRTYPGDCKTADKCEFDVELRINIPLPQPPCPVIKVSKFDVTSNYIDCVQGENRFEIIPRHRPPDNCKDDAGECAFDVELSINVPLPRPICPEIKVKKFDLIIGYPITECFLEDKTCGQDSFFTITRTRTTPNCNDPFNPGQCDFSVEMQLFIPPPKIPCPAINVKTFEVKTGYANSPCVEGGENTFTVTPRIIPCTCEEPEKCEFDVELKINVPIPRTPCPIIRVSKFKVESDYADCGTGNNRFEIIPRHRPPNGCKGDDDPGECAFDVEVEIFIPIPRPPCPEIKVTSFTVGSGFDSPECPKNKNIFEIRPRKILAPCDDPFQQGKCEFEVELGIFIPIPKPPCPAFFVNTFEVKSGFTNSPCVDDTNRFTITPRPIPGDCTTADTCEFDIDVVINVPIPLPPCPVIRVSKFKVDSDYADCGTGNNRFEIIPRHRPPGNCKDDPGECAFDVEVEIFIPLPRPPCPDIKVTSFSVESGFATDECPKNKNVFEIKPRKSPAPCDDITKEGECGFDVELGIFIPIPKPPCPAFFVNTFEVKSGFTNSPCVDDNNRFTITPRVIPGDCNTADTCEFDIDVVINVPIPLPPCPVFDVKRVDVTSSYPDCKKPSTLIISPRHRPPGNCKDDPGECAFDVELTIDVPIPKPPCPEIKVTTFEVTSSYEDCPQGDNRFLIIPRHKPPGGCSGEDDPGECAFDIELTINVPIPRPPCPEFRIITFDVIPQYPVCLPPPPFDGCPGKNIFKISRQYTKSECGGDTKTEDCNFDVELTIAIPPPKIPCPTFNVDFEFKTGYKECQTTGDGLFKITPRITPCTCDEPEKCDFDVELKINVPIPRPVCPDITVKKFDLIIGYPVADCISEDRACGSDSFFTITPSHTPTNCDDPLNPGKCEFGAELQIFIPPPKTVCPVINIKTFEVKTGYAKSPCVEGGKNKFVISPTVTPCTCDEPEKCTFDVELEIVVPIPQPPCPKIKIKTFEVKTGYADCTQGKNRFEITPNHTPPTGCGDGTDDPGQCSFDVELEINVPIPRPPCPEFRIITFDVIPQYPTCFPPPYDSCPGKNIFKINRKYKKSDCGDSQTQDGCDFDVELSIAIPQPKIPCPTFNVDFEFKTGYESCLNGGGGGPPENKFVITPRIIPCTCEEPEKCEFDVELKINVPIPEPPCPQFNILTFNVVPQYPVCIPPIPDSCPGKNKFKITPKSSGPCDENGTGKPECNFDVELEIAIPQPKIPCPTFNIKTFDVKSDYKRCLTGTGGGTSTNKFAITPRIIPCTCDEPEKCEFDIELEINVPIPEPPCPDIRTSLNLSYKTFNPYEQPPPPNTLCPASQNRFRVTKSTQPPPCGSVNGTNSTPSCTFSLELDLCIPVPRIPCPEFNLKTVKVEAKYEKCLTSPPTNTKFTITKNNDIKDKCSFDIELELYIPIPEPACPRFIGNFVVNTFLRGANCGVPGAWFTVDEAPDPGSCQDGTPDTCNFLFDLGVNLPLPRFVSDVFITVAPFQPTITWCPVGNNPVPPKIKFNFVRQQNQWAGACDRGDMVWYEAQFDLDIVIPRFPCNYIKLVPFRDTYPIKRTCVRTAQEYFKLFIRPDPGQPNPAGGGCEPCQYQFDFDIQLKQPCKVVLKGTDGEVVAGDCYDTSQPNQTQKPDPNDPFAPPQGTGGRIWLSIERPQQCGQGGTYAADDCTDVFILKPNIELPPPKFPCPEFNIEDDKVKIEYLTNRDDDPTIELKIDEAEQPDKGPCDPCKYDVTLDIKIPEPCYPKFTYNPSGSTFTPQEYVNSEEYDALDGRDPNLIKVIITERPDTKCEYDVSIEASLLQYRPVCPEFYEKDGGVNVHYLDPKDPDAKPHAEIAIELAETQPPGKGCVYEISLDIYVDKPCKPKFKTTYAPPNPCYYTTKKDYNDCVENLDPGEFVKIEILNAGDDTDPCKYDVHVYTKPIWYEPSNACDEFITTSGIRINPTTLAPWEPLPASTLKIVPRQRSDEDDHCTYDVTADIYIRDVPCPVIWYSPGGLQVIPVDDWGPMYYPPDLRFPVTAGDKGECKIEFAGQIYVPKSEVKIGKKDVKSVACDAKPYLDISITKPDNQCKQTLDVTLFLPPRVEVQVGAVTANWVACTENPKLEINISPPNSDCKQTLTASLYIPKPPEYVSAPWTVSGGLGTASSTVDSTGCQRKVSGTISLYTTTCPQYMTAMPMQDGRADAADTAAEPNVIMTLWDQPEFVDGFIAALETNERLRNSVKTLLKD